jgi:N-acetylglucosaminylphosphatidylinositol deacetylase
VKHLLQTLPDGPTKPRLFTLISVPKSGKYVGVMAPVMAKVDLYISKTMLYYDTLITRALERAEIIPAGSKSPSEMNEMKRTLMPVFISGLPAYRTAFKAMLAHKSQLVWFRWLYLLFSRYMWINEWTEVKN